MPQLLALYKTGAQNGGFEAGVRLALQKILVSPEFLFRAEIDPPGAAPGSVYRVSDVELASRLSFFLWSSIPDDELLAVAESGRLCDPSVLQAQVKRMLADPRSQAAGEELRRPMAVPAQHRKDHRRIRRPFRISTRICARRWRRKPSSWSKARCGRIAASPIC